MGGRYRKRHLNGDDVFGGGPMASGRGRARLRHHAVSVQDKVGAGFQTIQDSWRSRAGRVSRRRHGGAAAIRRRGKSNSNSVPAEGMPNGVSSSLSRLEAAIASAQHSLRSTPPAHRPPGSHLGTGGVSRFRGRRRVDYGPRRPRWAATRFAGGRRAARTEGNDNRFQ